MALSIGEAGASLVEGGAAAEGATAVGAAGAAEAGSAASAATATTASTTTWGSIGTAAAKMAANAAVSYAVSSIFNRSGSIAHPDVQTFLGNGYSSVDQIPVLYGRRRIGGSRATISVRGLDGAANNVLLQIVIWCEGEVAELGDVYFDNVLAGRGYQAPQLAGSFFTYGFFYHHVGTDDQPADSVMIGDVADQALWNANCKMSGIAYTYVRLGWNPDVFPNGRPTITCDVKGRLLYDPRDASTAWSRNPALAIREYLTNTRYGCRVPEAMIDDTAIGDAADFCDELVAVPNFRLDTLSLASGGSGYEAGEVLVLEGGVATRRAEITIDTVDGGGAVLTFHVSESGSYTTTSAAFTQYSVTQHQTGTDSNGFPVYGSGSGATFNSATFTQDQQVRYSCDGVVNIDQQPMDNVRALLTACRGFLVFSGGQYRLKIDKAETQVSFVLDEDNIVGGWQIQLGNKQNRFNRVKARFFNENAEYQPDIAVWPTPDLVTGEDPVGDAYRAEDGGLILESQIDLPFTTDLYRAQQICQIELKRSRANMMVSLVATIAATCLEVGDVVPVAHATPGWPATGDPAEGKLFRVVEIELLNNDEVRLVLREYLDAVYDLDDLHQIVQPQGTSLPDATSAAAPGTPSVLEELYETTGSAGVKSRAVVTWGAAADIWVSDGGFYELEYKLAADADFQRVSPVSDAMWTLQDLAPGRYDFRVRSVNVLGVHSAYSATTTAELLGLTQPPSDPQNFAAQAYGDHVKFTWDRPTAATDLDVVIGGRAFIRWTPKTSGASWNEGSLVNVDGYAPDGTDARGPLQTGTYLLKFRDSSGNYSENAASFVVTEALLTGLSTLVTVTESPTFAGTKTNVVAVDSILKLAGSTDWDSIPGNIDDWGFIDSTGGVLPSGSYEFASKMDLGSVKSCRLFATIRSLAFDTADNWDDNTANIDDWGLIDGDVVEDADVVLMVRLTTDDPNAVSPTWGPWHRLGLVADYNARGFDFRLDFTSGNPTHNRQVDQLVVTAKQ